MMPRPALRIGFIGDGSITHSIRDVLKDHPASDFEIASILCRSTGRSPLHTLDVGDMLRAKPHVVVECAGHIAVAEFGEAILRAGIPLIVVSIGALGDDELLHRLLVAAEAGNTRMMLASGAVGGIDALAAARIGGLRSVRYVGRKPPSAWMGSPAQDLIDLNGLREANVFYRGSAREAALRFPQNANVAATIALAGLGFDRTEVELIADPTISKNIHELMFEGSDGRVEMTICGEPSPSNPKTSALTAHSIARLLLNMASPIVI